MKIKDKPRLTVVTPRNPILAVMAEPFTRGDGTSTNKSLSDILYEGLLRKALDGDKNELLRRLKECAAREIKLMGEGRHKAAVVYELPNLDYERGGDVAALLRIVRPMPAPPHNKRDPFERDQRYGLAKWLTPYARKLGRCSAEHFADIDTWEKAGCLQWRRWRGMEFPVSDEVFDYSRGEWTDPLAPYRLPQESVSKPKRSIHLYDKKVIVERDGVKTRMPLIEVLFRRAREYALTHPNDEKFAAALLKIGHRVAAAREKQGSLTDSGPLYPFGDDELYPHLPISCLEDALIGMDAAVILFPYRKYARAVLKPWLVQAALDRMKKGQLSYSEQMRIVTRTLHPDQVNWPDWWEVDWFKKPGSD